jgi:thiamine biosynthesis lipoprotein
MTQSRHNRATWIAASAAILGSAVPAPAETYLTESQALSAILGENVIVRREDRTLEPSLRAKLEHDTKVKFPEAAYTFFLPGPPNQPQKFAIVMNEIGKSEPITFMVGINDQGKVTEVVIMVFRENRGWEVKEKRFLNQFKGKTVRSPIRVEEDIINYTGATLSSKAVARGVKRALALVNALYLADNHHAATPAAARFAKPLPIYPLISVTTAGGRTALYRQARYAMGTFCEIRLWCASPGEARASFHAAFAELERLEQIFSAYREDSELSRVNREAGQRCIPVSADFFRLAQYAKRSWKRSKGISDITIAPLLKAWGFRSDQPQQPPPHELLAARAEIGCDKLVLNSQPRSIRFLSPNMQLDFGGLAKGYAAQRVAQLLHSRGVHSAFVNLGRSSLSASALNRVDTENRIAREMGIPFGHWLVAVTSPNPWQPTPLYILLRPNENLSTSGTSERQFQCNNRTVSHIIDPRTGEPVTGLRSVTAITQSGASSEVLAKQLLIDRATSSSQATRNTAIQEEWISLDQTENGITRLDADLRRERFTDRT